MSNDSLSQNKDVILAAGGVVWRESNGERLVAIVHRPKYDDWTLPKGKLKDGETWQVAAQREVEEEIQCHVRVGDFAGCCCYSVDGIPKVILFWQMELVQEEKFIPNKEIDKLLWLPRDWAIVNLDYEVERDILKAL